MPLPEYGARPGSFEATPLMIDGTLYFPTMYSRVVALDAETGAEKWVFDPRVYELGGRGSSPGGFKHRGLAFRRAGDDLHLYLNSRVRLFAIDAASRQPITSFGDNGSVHLTQGHGREVPDDDFDQTSPPVVFEDLVIVGSRVPDRVQRRFDTPGSVQAFDARTGERRWIFFTVPQSNDAFGADTWEDQSWRYTGHANVWGLMSLDEERGLLYVPTSTPSSDYWGGRRPGANLFAESLLCLDARTGERQWHFQAVHHGLWDYDFTSPPNLVTINVDGREIEAVAEVSKQGFTYVFDRVTGEPVWPIEERPVDTTTDVPGEVVYPTQPFPTRPPPFAGQGVSLDDANDLTPEINALAREEMSRFRLGPLFTPPALRGTLQRPTHRRRRQLGRRRLRPADRPALRPVDREHQHQPGMRSARRRPGRGRRVQQQLPARRRRTDLQRPARRVRLRAQPVGTDSAHQAAVRLPDRHRPERGGHRLARAVRRGQPHHPQPSAAAGRRPARAPGHPGRQWADVTAGDLLFIGGGDPYLYAFDKATGAEVWRGATPFRTSGNPMTYRTASGRQFIVIATGAGPDAALVAFTLPG